jgi:hypothetical protein
VTNCPGVRVPIEHGHVGQAPEVVGGPNPGGEVRDSSTPADASGPRFTTTKVAETVAGGVTVEGAAAPTARSAPGLVGPKRKTSLLEFRSSATRFVELLVNETHRPSRLSTAGHDHPFPGSPGPSTDRVASITSSLDALHTKY